MNVRRLMTPFAALTAGLLFATPALAQDEEAEGDRKVSYKARTEIDFEGVDGSGELRKPNGALLPDRQLSNCHPLIKLRPHLN